MRIRQLTVCIAIMAVFFNVHIWAEAVSTQKVRIETSIGDITIEVYVDQAPLTSAYFLDMVEEGRYNGGRFYRSTPLNKTQGPKLIQGGMMYAQLVTSTASEIINTNEQTGAAIKLLNTIETTEVTGLRHAEATVSFARDLYNTTAVIPEIFICLGDFPELDVNGRSWPDVQGFPAFGKVVEGLEVVREISERNVGGDTHIDRLKGQILSDPIMITRVITITN
ncbi:peptidylprolyl isomerase [Pseudomaricurvus alkylphenolicus]|uniref:peptidylprolyl isomerase n=1 Tax=Pseudomaricurvus alkylphenolicus TaxID=1306991 RepID=UPI001424417F|nr:peptidylprolyl isomerase [Pseudomaricurvus alkylphenolicus]NIB42660.1 peptidylprolyl isomerase [Pseudomaricurvus alkylphenolicus]